MNFAQHKLIIITPVYEDLEASGHLFKILATQFESDIFVVAVDDGSIKHPLEVTTLKNAKIDGVILKLYRNVGHQRAIAIGLGYASEYIQPNQRVIVMDSDGEDLPSTIPYLLETLESNKIDVAVAKRKSRVETIRFKVFYFIYKRFFNLMTGRFISFGNFMALKPDAIKRLVVMQELSIHVAAAVLASKLRTETCLLDRGARYAGESKMNFVGLALHGFKALMVFAEDVLVRIGIGCALIAGLSVIGGIAAVTLKLIGVSTPGWFSVALGILILIFLQTGTLALMTLMLTGIIRSDNVTKPISYQDFIKEVIETNQSKGKL